jgi:hypothetical protein
VFYHPVENHYLTPRECLKLHSFSYELAYSLTIAAKFRLIIDFSSSFLCGSAFGNKISTAA